MIARVRSFESTREQAADTARILEEEVIPVLREREGFSELAFLVEPSSGNSLIVAFWDDEAALKASEAKWAASPGAAESSEAVSAWAQTYEVALRTLRDDTH
jgi:Antibiotic biosynthesis monooxygenase